VDLVRAPGGRRLAVEEFGDPRGIPVFLLHGMPGSRLGPHPRASLLYRLGIRLITFDRPGYGQSDRKADRSVADAAADVLAVADAYSLARFAIVGRSGGAPHALACAALLPGRAIRVASLVSLAPPDAKGLNWFHGMAPSNVTEFMAALRGYNTVAPRLFAAARKIRLDPAKLVSDLQTELLECDKQIVSDVGIKTRLLAAYSEAFRLTAFGWIDDMLALSRPWQFDLADIHVPVLLWHGAQDKLSPVSHAHWLANEISDITVIIDPGAAHFGALSVLPEVLNWTINGKIDQAHPQAR
jgi:pimeloyl-ACP methyl ester carboxylesterase